MNEKHYELLKKFALDGNPVSCDRYGFGHINETYLVVTDVKHRYIFQKLSTRAFKDVPGLMNNIYLVTSYLRERTEDPYGVMTVIKTLDGGIFLEDAGEYWRLYDFVEGSVALQAPRNTQDFYESAIAFGEFQTKLDGFPVEKLVETIPNFHNTVDRYRIFKETLAKDPCGRAKDVQAEIDFVLAHEEEMGTLQRMRESGELPTRVTHNDTKLNNVLLRETNYKPLCVIDLDTVMPGLSLYDYGDSIRFGAATAAEDEKDLSKVTMSLEMFRIFTEGSILRFAEYFKDYPKGVLTFHIEQDDPFEFRKALPNVCIMGGLTTELLNNGTPEECVAYTKRLCDELGKEGGFILSEGKMLSYRNDANRENYKAVCDFVSNYKL